DVGRLQGPVGVVAEGLFDPRDGHLVLDGDGDLVVEHRQGRQGLLFGDEQAGGGGRREHDQQGQQREQRSAHGSVLSFSGCLAARRGGRRDSSTLQTR